VYFDYHHYRHIFNVPRQAFELTLFHLTAPAAIVSTSFPLGYSTHTASLLRAMTSIIPGRPNLIDVDPVSIPQTLMHKLIHPFYIFQALSCIIWFYEAYTTYAAVLVIMTTISITWEIWGTVRNAENLKRLVAMNEVVTVLRDGRPEIVRADAVVVGDAIVLKSGTPVVCDVVVVRGECIVDESTLTGESVPIVKHALQVAQDATAAEPFSFEKYKANCLFSGSLLLQAKSQSQIEESVKSNVRDLERPALGVVVATGFSTLKGDLFRGIIYPKPIKFKFYGDSYKFLAVLAVVAMLVFIKRVTDGVHKNVPFYDTLITSLDLITIAGKLSRRKNKL
jgi:cation-transporting ATPase 13A2